MPRLSVRVEHFKPLRSGSLRGFLDVTIPEWGLQVREITAHESYGKRWIGLPARPRIDCHGHVHRDGRGKVLYTCVLQFVDRDASAAFSAQVIAALDETYPHAFSENNSAST
jgi:hypothetical protein